MLIPCAGQNNATNEQNPPNGQIIVLFTKQSEAVRAVNRGIHEKPPQD